MHLQELEMAELAKSTSLVTTTDLRQVDTESNIRGRIRGMYNTYCGQRWQDTFNASLLRKIKHQLLLYALVSPGCNQGPLVRFEDVQKAVAALPKPKSQSAVGKREHFADDQVNAIRGEPCTDNRVLGSIEQQSGCLQILQAGCCPSCGRCVATVHLCSTRLYCHRCCPTCSANRGFLDVQ